MAISSMSGREFNQAVSEAKKAANLGPVYITDRGKPSHVLMSIAHYQRLAGGQPNISELLSMPSLEDMAFDPPKLSDLAQAADLS
jgi:prevent-host-death family protein